MSTITLPLRMPATIDSSMMRGARRPNTWAVETITSEFAHILTICLRCDSSCSTVSSFA